MVVCILSAAWLGWVSGQVLWNKGRCCNFHVNKKMLTTALWPRWSWILQGAVRCRAECFNCISLERALTLTAPQKRNRDSDVSGTSTWQASLFLVNGAEYNYHADIMICILKQSAITLLSGLPFLTLQTDIIILRWMESLMRCHCFQASPWGSHSLIHQQLIEYHRDYMTVSLLRQNLWSSCCTWNEWWS